jgi:hypothetical protein
MEDYIHRFIHVMFNDLLILSLGSIAAGVWIMVCLIEYGIKVIHEIEAQAKHEQKGNY